MKEIRHRWIILITVAIVGLFIDWYTKYLAQVNLTYGVPKNIFGEYFQLLLVYNKGAVFGINPKSFIANFPTNQFFFIFNIIAVVAMVIYYKFLPLRERALHWGIALVIPGALGNLLDRVIRPGQGVVDFIKMGISADTYWPIYNIADVYVTFGVIILLYCFITEDIRKKKYEVKVVSTANSEKAE